MTIHFYIDNVEETELKVRNYIDISALDSRVTVECHCEIIDK